jgi:hypothetical protein
MGRPPREPQGRYTSLGTNFILEDSSPAGHYDVPEMFCHCGTDAVCGMLTVAAGCDVTQTKSDE